MRKRGGVVKIEYFIHADRFAFALDLNQINFSKAIRALQLTERKLADQDIGFIILVGAFKAGGEINAIADDRVIHALQRTDITRQDFVRTDANANVDRVL